MSKSSKPKRWNPDLDDAVTGVSAALRSRLPDAAHRAQKLLERRTVEALWWSSRANILADKAAAAAAAAERDGDMVILRHGGYGSRVDIATAAAMEALEAEQQARRREAQLAAVEEMLAKAGGGGIRSDHGGPTPETLARVRRGETQDAVTRLVALGHLSPDMARTAREIAAVVEYAACGLGMKTVRFPTSDRMIGADAPQRVSAIDADDWYDLLHHWVYVPWCRRYPRGSAMAIALAAGDISVEALRRRYGGAWATVLREIGDALDAFGKAKARYVKAGAL